MFTLFFALTIAVLITQSIHTWFVFNSFSQIENKFLKIFQSIVFCGILSAAILAFVWKGEKQLALAGALIEMIINIYYYAIEFWENGFKQKKSETRKKAIQGFWRRYWIRFVFALIIPVLIYIFSEQMLELR